jgi:hypothetical protein
MSFLFSFNYYRWHRYDDGHFYGAVVGLDAFLRHAHDLIDDHG